MIAFSADGRLLAGAGANRLRLWDVVTGKELHARPGDSEQAGLKEPSHTTPKKRRLDSRKEASQSPSSKLVVSSGELVSRFPNLEVDTEGAVLRDTITLRGLTKLPATAS